MPSPDEIRALDGPALTRLAWEWGMAPSDVVPVDSPVHAPMFAVKCQSPGLHTFWLPWAPSTDLAQADAVFRQLRARGWYCGTTWDPTGATTQVNVWHPSVGRQSHIAVRYGWEGENHEALALLRCAVLAVASEAASP
jgi:hypothetical protein